MPPSLPLGPLQARHRPSSTRVHCDNKCERRNGKGWKWQTHLLRRCNAFDRVLLLDALDALSFMIHLTHYLGFVQTIHDRVLALCDMDCVLIECQGESHVE